MYYSAVQHAHAKKCIVGRRPHLIPFVSPASAFQLAGYTRRIGEGIQEEQQRVQEGVQERGRVVWGDSSGSIMGGRPIISAVGMIALV